MSTQAKKSSVNYLYIRDNLRQPLMTVAYTRKADEVWVGWAAINTKGTWDDQGRTYVKDRYSKETGRYIAEGRLMKNPMVVIVPVTGDATLDRRVERSMVLHALLFHDTNKIPHGVRKYVEQRIKAIDAKRSTTPEVPGEPLFTAEIKNDVVYAQKIAGNGPLPLSWLVKYLREGEWQVTRIK